MQQTAPRPRGRPQSVKRGDILTAAEATFAAHGYANTSLRQLIAAAGVSTTAFYARFPSREAVLAALVTSWVEQLAAAAAARLTQARELEPGFQAGIDVLLDACRGRKALVRLLLSEAAAGSEARDTLAEAYRALATLLSGRLARLASHGLIEPADVETVGWALVGAVKIQLERWAVLEQLSDDELEGALVATARALLPMLRPRGATKGKR